MSKYSCVVINHTDSFEKTIVKYLEHRKEYQELLETVDSLYEENNVEKLKELISTQSEDDKLLIINHIIILKQQKEEEKLMSSIKTMSDELDFPAYYNTNPIYKNNSTHINNNIVYHPNEKIKTKKKITRRLP